MFNFLAKQIPLTRSEKKTLNIHGPDILRIGGKEIDDFKDEKQVAMIDWTIKKLKKERRKILLTQSLNK